MACIVFGAMLGCTPGHQDSKLATYRGVHVDDVKTFDPAVAYDQISWDVIPDIYETLYDYDYLSETYKVAPLLALDLPSTSKDRLTVTIRLRPGVMFQDDGAFQATHGKGRELVAADFIYGWKRLALPSLQSGGWWIFDGKIAGINAFRDRLAKAGKEDQSRIFNEPIEGLQALDDHTLQIKLLKPYPQLQFILTLPFTSPMAHEVVAAHADPEGNVTDHPIGTGPFRLTQWKRGNSLLLERNPTYHASFYPTQASPTFTKQGLLTDSGRKLPFLDRIEIQVIKEAQPAWLKFLKGEVDVLDIPKDNFGSAIQQQSILTPELQAKGLHLSIDTGVSYYDVAINMKDKLLGGNKALRQALSSAIDREKWIELFTNGRGRKQTTALPPGILDRPATSTLKYDFDLVRARNLMKKAGYPAGKGLPPLNFDLRGADSVSRQLGEFFSQQWARIGIQVNIVYNSFPAFLEKSKQGNLQLSLGGWIMDYPDPENVYQLLYGPNGAPGPNDSNFNHPVMNDLYKKMALMNPGPARAALIRKMDDLLQEEVPWALGYYSTDYRLSQPWLFNYRPGEVLLDRHKYLRIDPEVRARYRTTN